MSDIKKVSVMDQQEIIWSLKAIANPSRALIIRHLFKCGTCTNTELVRITQKSQATVSQHVKILLKVKIINMRVQGRYSIYSLNEPLYKKIMIKMKSYIDGFDI